MSDEVPKQTTEGITFRIPLDRYWFLIHIFSAFSRRMWLRAIKYRTENVTLEQ